MSGFCKGQPIAKIALEGSVPAVLVLETFGDLPFPWVGYLSHCPLEGVCLSNSTKESNEVPCFKMALPPSPIRKKRLL